MYVEPGASVTITDSDLSGGSEAVIAFDNWTAIRVNIHDFGADGVKFGSNVRLQDSYIHNFASLPGAHADGGQLQSGESNIVIQHNTVAAHSATGVSANSALFIAPDLGPTSAGPISISGNLLGGGGYTVYLVDGNNGEYLEKNITFSNNRMADDYGYGHLDVTATETPYITAAGNVDEANRAPIPLN